jgi:predicted transglutaminase-like cysteine proteinase
MTASRTQPNSNAAPRRPLAFAAILLATLWSAPSQAAFFGLPKALRSQVDHMSFDAPALPPMGHTRFCLQYQDDCEVHGIDFRHRNIELTPERLAELSVVDREVNRDIIPQRQDVPPAAERWRIAPLVGNCHDYAVTKRHELLARGWPSRSLLLSEVVTASGEHHLVLIVRMKDVDLVLDNLNANLLPIGMTHYQWVRTESPVDPKFWSTVSLQAGQQVVLLDQ